MDLVDGGRERSRTIVDRREAIRAIIGEAKEGDTVVIAGKGHEDYQIVGRERLSFDDREEAREALRGLGYGR
jgi:UDP-N-acetylmuramoyl-L-alanyl-D-glutamate--2,6-diaminopimelate ligase